MSFTQKILIPLSDQVDTFDIVHKNVFESEGDRIALKLTGNIIVADDFDNGSLDTTNFGTSTNANGSVVETTELSVISPNSPTDASLIYSKYILSPRATNAWIINVRGKALNFLNPSTVKL